MDWIRGIQRAIDYIEGNLTQELDYAEIAEKAYSSSFHFQRTFNLLTGMTVGEYIRSRRLSKAGEELAAANGKVIDTALKYGYDTPESFTKAFTRFHGVTPSQARNEGVKLKSFNRLSITITMKGGKVMEYHIIKRDSFKVLVRAKSFPSDNSKDKIPVFWDESRKTGTINVLCKYGIKNAVLGMCEPAKKGENTFRYAIGIECGDAAVAPEGFEVWTLPSQTWAVFQCVGPMPGAIQEMWERIYSEFFPQSEYEPVEVTDFELYPEGDMQKKDYVSEIWIPVRKKAE